MYMLRLYNTYTDNLFCQGCDSAPGLDIMLFTPRFAGVSAVTDSHLVCRKIVLDEEKLAEYRQTPAGERLLFLETVIEPMIATLDYADMSDDE